MKHKGFLWIKNGWRTDPGERLMANLKPGAWAEIHHKSTGEFVGYGWAPTNEDGAKLTFETRACYSIATAKKRLEIALLEHDCLIDRTTIGRDPQ